MWKRILNEPVVITSLVSSAIALGIGFGLKVTPEQLSLIMAFVGTLLAFLARAAVTPNQLAEERVAQGGSPTVPRNNVVAFVLAGLTAAMLLSGCGANPTPTTSPTVALSPSGIAAYQATRVVKSLDLLRDIAVAGEKSKAVSADTALKVIAYHRQVVRTIGTVPDGWKAVAFQGLDEVQHNIPAGDWQKLLPWISLLKTVYAETGGAQ